MERPVAMRTWSEKLAVGVEEFDQQHMQLFGHLDTLITTLGPGQPESKAAEILNLLGDDMQDHHAAEERLMAAMGYPGFDSHQEAHEGFMQEVWGILVQFHTLGTPPNLLQNIHRDLSKALANHIAQWDKPLGEFIAKGWPAPARRK